MKKTLIRPATPAQEETPKDLAEFQQLLAQPGLEPDFLKEKLAAYLQKAFENDDGALWGLLFTHGYEKKLTPMYELGLFAGLQEFLAGARRENKLNVFMEILVLIKKYIVNGGPGTAVDDVPISYIETILLEKVGNYTPYTKSDEHDPTANEFVWVHSLLSFYGKTFLPNFIRDNISPKQPELAYWLYNDQGLRSFLNSEPYDYVLEVACRNDDEKMLEYCFKLEAEKKKMNLSNERCPVLCIAITQKNIQRINRLFEVGANVNIVGGEEPNRMTAAHCAISTNDLAIVKLVVDREDFDWNQSTPDYGSVLRAACSNVVNVTDPTENTKALEIFRYIMQAFQKNARPALHAQLIHGSTTLTYAIVNTRECRECAALLIQAGIGVFALDQTGRSPLYWAREYHDKDLEAELKKYYKANVKKIVDLLLTSDPRVCQKPAGRSVCTLEMAMVSEWVDLKEDIFLCLQDLSESNQISIRQLRKIKEQIDAPNSALSQFFALGHGNQIWRSASPWPARFAPLLESMKSKISANNSLTECSSPLKF